ncbi:MAG: hypothetical protein K6G17_09815 [Oscillospiraceae bacterium]|nr:hypothetical protein [Oscillospiraceae bacterium]
MKITKKNGTVCLFDDEKVTGSILKAHADVKGEKLTPALARALADEVFARLTGRGGIISSADVRECVAALLREKNLTKTAKSYLEYKK